MTTVSIYSPLDGWCAPMQEVADPVFAGLMLGDGLAVDPTTGLLSAPCDGEIITVAAAGHAVTVRHASGIEVLVHVGIDTVQLGGRGFQVLVKPGQQVMTRAGLMRFDLDAIARAGKSLLTPVVVGPAEEVEIVHRRPSGVVRTGEVLFEVSRRVNRAFDATQTRVMPQTSAASQGDDGGAIVRRVVVTLRHGLHARPAAMISQRLRSVAAEVQVEIRGKSANARSVVALLSLEVRAGDEIVVRATGSGSGAAVDTVLAGLAEALRAESLAAREDNAVDVARTTSQPTASAAGPSIAHATADAGAVLTGVTAVPGYVVGVAARLERRELAVAESGAGVAVESAELLRARNAVRKRLTRLGEAGGSTRRDIAAAHVAFLDDPLLNEVAQELIDAGKSAGHAWRAATRRQVNVLRALADLHLRERADDLMDVEAHVLYALAGEARPMNQRLPASAVLLADDLLPSELVSLDREQLRAICLGNGGASSHVAILAAAMDVPMLVAVGAGLREIADGTVVIVDAHRGAMVVAPSPEALARAATTATEHRVQRAAARSAAQRDCRSLDGTRIEVFANVGSTADAVAAVANGAEGCGLLRTEFLFMDRDTAPSEAEQLAAYQSVAAALGERPLVLRLMDVGGDKPLPYLPLPPEDNPALGLRGIRTALWRKDLLRTQLRAALQVRPASMMRLLLPMITDVAEVRAVREIVDELRAPMGEGIPVQIGAMIETPAAALTAGRIIREVDFLSIGSNDLTQYTLAMDRGHPELAARLDALHPAVLQLIGAAAAAARAVNRVVAVCGGVAADMSALPVLLGLGVTELSVVPAAIPAVKRLIRTLDIGQCVAIATQCLALESAAEVRALVARSLTAAGETR